MRKLTIGLDYRPALSRATGVGRYFQGLVGGLSAIDADNDYVLFSSSWKERASNPSAFMTPVRSRERLTVLKLLSVPVEPESQGYGYMQRAIN